jgi:hypothetical protein
VAAAVGQHGHSFVSLFCFSVSLNGIDLYSVNRTSIYGKWKEGRGGEAIKKCYFQWGSSEGRGGEAIKNVIFSGALHD